MKSITELYKIGYGPSSSHTMGPQKACELFLKRFPEATRFKVVLFGSLAFTGRGHLTDRVIQDTLKNVEVIFDENYLFEHPNTMDIFGYATDGTESHWRVYSVGGGTIRIDGLDATDTPEVYPHLTFDEIKRYCRENKIRLYQYVEQYEGPAIWDFLDTVMTAMDASIERGIASSGELPGELRVKKKAMQLFNKFIDREPPEIYQSRILSAYAYAVGEENASGHIVVTAPTCGSSGIVPSVLRYQREKNSYSRPECLRGLATAGLIGNIIKHNATLSGAIAGCQAEVGSATAMAAALIGELSGASLGQIEYAAEVSMEHNLGLTCDPLLGYVQIPCIERNAIGAMRAVDCYVLASFTSASRKISLDMVIDTMYQTGKDIHTKYRETGTGGLALLYQKIKPDKGEDN